MHDFGRGFVHVFGRGFVRSFMRGFMRGFVRDFGQITGQSICHYSYA